MRILPDWGISQCEVHTTYIGHTRMSWAVILAVSARQDLWGGWAWHAPCQVGLDVTLGACEGHPVKRLERIFAFPLQVPFE